MNKTDALLTLLAANDAAWRYQRKRSLAEAKRILRACKVLEIEDPLRVLASFDYVSNGEPTDEFSRALLS